MGKVVGTKTAGGAAHTSVVSSALIGMVTGTVAVNIITTGSFTIPFMKKAGYTPEQARRHEIKPGITGWAPIKGRNALSWEERFAHDVWYVDHRSLFLDLNILLLPPLTVLRREGITAEGSATMPPFQGVPRESHD